MEHCNKCGIFIGNNEHICSSVWHKGTKGLIKNANKGKTYEEIYGEKRAKEIKKQLRESHLDKKQSLKTTEKRSESLKKLHAEGRHSGAFKKGHSNSPMKGKQWPDLMKKRISEKVRKLYEEGKKSRFNGGTFKIGQKPWNTGKTLSEKTKEKLKEARAKQILPIKDTKIEVKIQMFLKELGYEFFTHHYMKIEHGYQCDILIPALNLVIECDGDYWHKYPVGLDKDHIRTKELIDKGFRVLRLWGREIRAMNLGGFKAKLKEE